MSPSIFLNSAPLMQDPPAAAPGAGIGPDGPLALIRTSSGGNSTLDSNGILLEIKCFLVNKSSFCTIKT